MNPNAPNKYSSRVAFAQIIAVQIRHCRVLPNYGHALDARESKQEPARRDTRYSGVIVLE
jgi:hypothetical protein